MPDIPIASTSTTPPVPQTLTRPGLIVVEPRKTPTSAGEKILEPDARLTDPEFRGFRGEDDACAGGQKAGYDKREHDVSADSNPVESSGFRNYPDRMS